MIPGFIKLDSHRFYSEVWPRINKDVEAIESNLKGRKRRGDLLEPLVIYWGYKGEIRDDNSIVAVSFADPAGPDEHWVAPNLASD